MERKKYFPSDQASQAIWLNTFQAQLLIYAVILGIPVAVTDKVTAGSVQFSYIINALSAIKLYAKSITGFKNIFTKGTTQTIGSFPALSLPVAPATFIVGYLNFIFLLVQNIKTNPAYNEETIGKALGIIGADSTFNTETFKPVIAADYIPAEHSVKVEFLKDDTDGMKIYTRLEGESVWNFLALDTESPYWDTRPLAQPGVIERREYMAFGWLNDHEIGLPSDPAIAIFPG